MKAPLLFILLFLSFSGLSQTVKYKPHITFFTEWNYIVSKTNIEQEGFLNNYYLTSPDLRLGALYHSKEGAIIGYSFGLIRKSQSIYLGYTFKAPRIFKRKSKNKTFPRL